jgi:hypothetical protein
MNNDAGKGDTYRPLNPQKWSEGYDRAFKPKDTNAPAPDDKIASTKTPAPLGPISTGFDEDILSENEES